MLLKCLAREIGKQALTPIAFRSSRLRLFLLFFFSRYIHLQCNSTKERPVRLRLVDAECFHHDISAFLYMYEFATIIPQWRENIRALQCVSTQGIVEFPCVKPFLFFCFASHTVSYSVPSADAEIFELLWSPISW